MPAPKTTGKTRAYLLMQNDAGLSDERNDCTVKALALATGISYQEAHSDLAARGRKHGKGLNNWDLRQAIKARGFGLIHLSPYLFIDRYPKSHQILQNITTHHPERFNRVWCDGHTYMFSCRGHVLIVRDGENLDWTKGTAKRVLRIYRITKRS